MDADGIDAAFLYPSLGLFAGVVEDPGLAAAMCRAYNRLPGQPRIPGVVDIQPDLPKPRRCLLSTVTAERR
jgi:hypothetical protein